MTGRGNVETLVLLQPMLVDTNSPDRDGMLIVANGLLVGILVHLDAPEHGETTGWFLEAGFGRLNGVRAPIFDTLEQATRWVRDSFRG